MDELQNEKLEKFMNSVNMEVNEKISSIINRANSEKRQKIEKAEDDALLEAYGKIQKCVKDSEAEYRKNYALKQQQLRIEQLKHREMLTENIFEAVNKKIISFTKSDKYKDYLISLVKKSEVNENCIIMISRNDAVYKEDIEKTSGCKTEVDPDIEIGGISVVDTGNGIVVDKTLDNAFEESRKNFSQKYSFGKEQIS